MWSFNCDAASRPKRAPLLALMAVALVALTLVAAPGARAAREQPGFATISGSCQSTVTLDWSDFRPGVVAVEFGYGDAHEQIVRIDRVAVKPPASSGSVTITPDSSFITNAGIVGILGYAVTANGDRRRPAQIIFC
jgi:hypothetical protein